MRKIDNFVNLYPVTKTLRFKLIPIGKTRENFDKNKLLEVDKERADNYSKAKIIIDKYYNAFINNCLNNFKFSVNPDNLKEYYDLSNSDIDKSDKTKQINEIQSKLRKEITDSFKDTDRKKELYDKLFKTELLDEILKNNDMMLEDQEVIMKFDKFGTYFQGFFTNRKNIFSDEDKVGSISYRLINENLKIFVSNIKVYQKVKDALEEEIKILEKEHKNYLKDFRVSDVFDIDYYIFCLTGEDINKYNRVICGFEKNENTKIQGLNELINLYNQKNKDKSKLPKFKKLDKQILSDAETDSFRFDVIDDDKTVYNLIDNVISVFNDKDKNVLENVKKVFDDLVNNEYDINNIYLSSNIFADLSNKCFKNYNVINLGIINNYDKTPKVGKSRDKYEKDKDDYIKKIKYLSIKDIENYIVEIGYEKEKILETINNEYSTIFSSIKDAISDYIKIDKTLNIRNDEKIVEKIKNILDSLLNLYKFIKLFYVYEESEQIDLSFYGEISELDFLNDVVSIYNKVRNYLTKKPYKTDKVKLNFNCSTLLNGWDVNKEKDNLGVLLLKDNKYYLGIMNKSDSKLFVNIDTKEHEGCYKKVNYKLLPGPNKMLPKVFLSKKGIGTYNPSKRVIDNYNKGTHKKGDNFNKDDMICLIDYFKESMKSHMDYSNFGFRFTDTNKYDDISEFYKEVAEQGYKITYSNVSSEYIDSLINEGKIYLFQIYNKDFSSYSKGNKNLHTLYFEQIFSSENLNDVVYKLNGEAEVFFREKSLEYKITHPKNQSILNKNSNNRKKGSIFKYDLIKDKRFTCDQFEFHVPVTINFKANEGIYNDKVNEAIKKCNNNYVIGIDRGERNLIYINVISEKQGLIEQFSLNDIINEYNGNTYTTDYHNLLDKKEKERDKARKSWGTIENIKELKEGYVSQVVHKICELIEKYDAIIVMEDLNYGFKNNRIKVEKQVYQKFEKMLIDKLNLYINKKCKISENGGLLKGYQLTRPYEGNKKMSFQNGFIFYVAPWNTSKIDPTTGFVNLFRVSNYSKTESRKEFIRNFDSINYNSIDKVFEFKFDYRKFDYDSTDYKNEWTITSFGKRILTFRNTEKNSSWDYKEIDLTGELFKLFENNKIIYNDGFDIKEQILNIDSKEFYDKLFNILKMILQMRNSKPKQSENDIVVDYMASPIKNKSGKYYNSNEVKENDKLPVDADSNGAYNIARKGLMIVERIKNGQNDKLTVISNKEWLEYAQTHLPI